MLLFRLYRNASNALVPYDGTDEEIIQQCGGRYSILFTNM